jgi:hypothetical protein
MTRACRFLFLTVALMGAIYAASGCGGSHTTPPPVTYKDQQAK